MADFRRLLGQVSYDIEQHVDRFKLSVKKRTGRLGPIQILAYNGHGTENRCFIKGRVLEDKGIARATDADSLQENLRATLKRFASVEIPGVRVRVSVGGMSEIAITNNEGYFDLDLRINGLPHPPEPWRRATFELIDDVIENRDAVRSVGKVLVPPPGCRFGVISDIDDTIIETHATSLVKMIMIMFTSNARTRLPFAGVAEFYRALARGRDQDVENPVFYVSRSLWNLYDLIEDFLQIQKLPEGPLLLRDHSLEFARGVVYRPGAFKMGQIARLLALYDNLPFILIGDSGQRDPEIYQEVVRRFPGRILAVYIRDIGRPGRQEAVGQIARRLREQYGVPLLHVSDTKEAAGHAEQNGWIMPASVGDIREAAEYDKEGMPGQQDA